MIGFGAIGVAVGQIEQEKRRTEYALFTAICEQVGIPCCSYVAFIGAQKAMRML